MTRCPSAWKVTFGSMLRFFSSSQVFCRSALSEACPVQPKYHVYKRLSSSLDDTLFPPVRENYFTRNGKAIDKRRELTYNSYRLSNLAHSPDDLKLSQVV